MSLELIINKGCGNELLKDLETVSNYDDLVLNNNESKYSELYDIGFNIVKNKYGLTKDETTANFAKYQVYKLSCERE